MNPQSRRAGLSLRRWIATRDLLDWAGFAIAVAGAAWSFIEMGRRFHG